MRRLRQSSIEVNRIPDQVQGLAFFSSLFVFFLRKKKPFLVCLPDQLFQTAQNLVEMVGNNGYYPLIFQQVSIFGQNALPCVASYVTCTSPIMHLICHPKFCITFVLHFSWVLPAVLREIENNAYEKFWDANKMHYGRCASGVSTNFALLKNLQEVLAWVLLKTCKQIRKAVFMHIVQLQKHLK